MRNAFTLSFAAHPGVIFVSHPAAVPVVTAPVAAVSLFLLVPARVAAVPVGAVSLFLPVPIPVFVVPAGAISVPVPVSALIAAVPAGAVSVPALVAAPDPLAVSMSY